MNSRRWPCLGRVTELQSTHAEALQHYWMHYSAIVCCLLEKHPGLNILVRSVDFHACADSTASHVLT